MLRRALSVWLLASCVAVPFGAAVASSDGLTTVARIEASPYTHVIDIRDVRDCAKASLPKARCLPFNNFVDASGKQIDFHALRWLLGTVGLSGAERVLVIGGDFDPARTVGTLLYQAGQKQVDVLGRPIAPDESTSKGEVRSMSREMVFTSPMRD